MLWMTLGVTKSPEALGLISFASGVPAAIASPLAGVLGDRYSRTRLMAFGNALLCLVYIGLGVVSGLGPHLFWISYLLIAGGSVISPLTAIGRSQLIAELLPAEERGPANFFDDIYLHLTWLAGPAIAGFAIAWLGYGSVLYLDAASYVIGAAFFMTIPSSLHVPGTKFRQLAANMLDGIRMLRASGLLVQLAILTFFFNFFFGIYSIALPILARDDFGGSRAYGLLWSAFAVGSFVGGIFFSRRAWTLRMGPSMAWVILLWGVLTILLTGAHSYGVVLAIMLACGLVYTPYEPLYKTMLQQIVPLPMQAKVSSSINPLTGLGQPVGSWLSGLSFAPLGLGGLWLTSGAATVLVGLAAFAAPKLRRYEGELTKES